MPTRRLAAILFADIAGYTALMQQDEQKALAQLEKFKAQVQIQVQQNQGELIQFYGDGCLAIFQSSVNAVSCAKNLQEAFQTDPKVPVRIGLHAGDIMLKEGNAYGNAVNIASRVESMGIPGAVLLSSSLRNQIRNQTEFALHNLGKFAFKNVEEPMSVYALANAGFVVPDPKRMQGKGDRKKLNEAKVLIRSLSIGFVGILVALGIWMGISWQSGTTESSEKSIAVLPFDNLSQDPEQNYFSDGISQDILSNLSGIQDLLVISFNSSKQYRNSNQSSWEIGDELGVRHLLTGSVHREGDKLRIRASLVEAETDRQLWAQTYDKTLEDIFQIQSEVSRQIATALKAELLPVEVTRLNQAPTENLEAWQEYSQGRYAWEQRGVKNLLKAEQHFLTAISLDSTFAQAYAALAQTYDLLGYEKDRNRDSMLTKTRQYAERAISLDPTNADAYAALADVYSWTEKGNARTIALSEKAVSLEPVNATAHQWLAEWLLQTGEFDRARTQIEIAKRLDPGSAIIQLTDAHIMMGEDRYTEATELLAPLYEQNPEVSIISLSLFWVYLETGQEKKALDIIDGLDVPEKETWLFFARKQPDSLAALKKRIRQRDLGAKEKYLFRVDNFLIQLGGEQERYIEHLDSIYFIRRLDIPTFMQLFPPPNQVRLHPRFQQMMQERGISVRPRAAVLREW